MSWNMAVPGVASAALRARLVVMTDSRTTSMPRRAARHFAVFLLLLAACLSALPVTAQSPLLSAVQPAADSSSSPATAPAPLSAAELNAIADRLQDEGERQKLIDTLRALAAARDAADAGPAEPTVTEDPSQAIIGGVLEQMRRAGSAFAAMGALFADLPAIAEWAQRQVDDPRRRALWTDALTKLGVTLLSATILFLLARWAIRRPLAALRTPRGVMPSVWLQLVMTILRAIVALVPIAVFAITAYGMLELLASSGGTRQLAQIVVLAFVAHYAIGITADKMLNQGKPLRVLRMDEESAHYALLWVRRLSALGIYGYAAVRIAEVVRIPPDGVDTIARLIAFAFTALVAVLILQVRQPVAARIRGDRPLDVPAGDATPAEAAAATPGTETPPQRSHTWRILRHRLGDIWHVLALLYVAATYMVWAFAVEGGFEIILRGTLLTIVILFAARVLRFGAEQGFGRLFAIGPETRQRFPGLEARANRYLPLLLGVIRTVIYIVALFAILQAWGIDTVGWLASEVGRGIVARTVTILLVLLITLALWEAIATAIEYYLTQPGPDGKPTPRSARVRTLLPLLRRTISIVLGVIAGLIVLSELGLNIAPLLAGAGVVGLAIGFGAQTLVKDIITGTFILTEDTVAVGDIVDLGGNAGVVEDISIRTIRLRDFDGIVHTIPYSEVTRIKNMTRGYAQAVFEIRVSYRENIDEVIAALRELGEEFRAEPEWGARILDPFEMIGVDALDPSHVLIKARFKTLPAMQWGVKREFLKRIKTRFDQLGIQMPFPQQTVWFGADKEGEAPPLRIRQDTSKAEPDPAG